MVGVWTSQDNKKTKALDPKGIDGRFFTCDTWWTGVTELLTTGDDGDSVTAKGLKPLRAEPDMVKLSQPVAVPPGWTDLAVQALASLWTVILLPLGEPLWVRLADGTTHHGAPFLVETMTEGPFRLCMKDKDPMMLVESDDDAEDKAHAELAQATSLEENLTSEESSTSQENLDSEEPVIASRQDTLPSDPLMDTWPIAAQPSLPTTKKPRSPSRRNSHQRCRTFPLTLGRSV
eukprot:730153-Amphidinium_carterae.2